MRRKLSELATRLGLRQPSAAFFSLLAIPAVNPWVHWRRTGAPRHISPFLGAIILKLYVQEATSPDAVRLVNECEPPYLLTPWRK